MDVDVPLGCEPVPPSTFFVPVHVAIAESVLLMPISTDAVTYSMLLMPGDPAAPVARCHPLPPGGPAGPVAPVGPRRLAALKPALAELDVEPYLRLAASLRHVAAGAVALRADLRELADGLSDSDDAAHAGLLHPHLVEQRSPLGAVLVVTDALRDEVHGAHVGRRHHRRPSEDDDLVRLDCALRVGHSDPFAIWCRPNWQRNNE